jgi:hypothetical protein
MERALVPRRREAVLGFKNALQLGQVGFRSAWPVPIILTPAPKIRQLKRRERESGASFGR